MYVTDCDEEIVFTSTAQPYLVTWHKQDKVHRIYVIRQSKKEMNKRLRVEVNFLTNIFSVLWKMFAEFIKNLLKKAHATLIHNKLFFDVSLVRGSF